jgi:hypothetical protein
MAFVEAFRIGSIADRSGLLAQTSTVTTPLRRGWQASKRTWVLRVNNSRPSYRSSTVSLTFRCHTKTPIGALTLDVANPVGYILMQVPSNMILGKISYPSWYIAGAMLIWGMIVSTLSRNMLLLSENRV